MSERTPIAPVLVPHGLCPTACPYCPRDAKEETESLLPDPIDVTMAIDRVVDRRSAQGKETGPVELAFYGGDFWSLPRPLRTGLLDTAEWEVRRGRAAGIRITLSPRSALRAPLSEFRTRGVQAVEVPIHGLERPAYRPFGPRVSPRLGLGAVGRLNRYRLRSIVHLTPGLPGTSHDTAMSGLHQIVAAKPSALRLLPALVLEDTALASFHRENSWEPMTLDQAVLTCRHMIEYARGEGVEIVRVGLQPEADLLRGPLVVAGPWDPNLRGRVESKRMLMLATSALTSAFSLGRRAFTFVVHPREESWLRGMESTNLRILKDQFRLDELRVLTEVEQPKGELRVLSGALDEVPPLPPRRGTRQAS